MHLPTYLTYYPIPYARNRLWHYTQQNRDPATSAPALRQATAEKAREATANVSQTKEQRPETAKLEGRRALKRGSRGEQGFRDEGFLKTGGTPRGTLGLRMDSRGSCSHMLNILNAGNYGAMGSCRVLSIKSILLGSQMPHILPGEAKQQEGFRL